MVLEFLDREIRADTKERTWPDLRLFSIKALNSIVLSALAKRFVNGREITTEMVLEFLDREIRADTKEKDVAGLEITTEMVLEFLDREIRADTKEKDEAGLQVVLSNRVISGSAQRDFVRFSGMHINYEARPLKAEIVAVSTNCLGDAANYPWLEYTYIVRRGGHYFLPSCSRSGFHYLPDLAGE
ncbi:hypothetical protein C8F04DRAFT_1192819 [Mycena alexandri]|uniref:Uncharacterized protein n=1 Tax=Mycena alexandri TaxID=1745969 RepID=A0AAD6WUN4_9AGAR|nr:hypothetical protein C8F04DRAFT_1192819 [Mycena alexandri]